MCSFVAIVPLKCCINVVSGRICYTALRQELPHGRAHALQQVHCDYCTAAAAASESVSALSTCGGSRDCNHTARIRMKCPACSCTWSCFCQHTRNKPLNSSFAMLRPCCR